MRIASRIVLVVSLLSSALAGCDTPRAEPASPTARRVSMVERAEAADPSAAPPSLALVQHHVAQQDAPRLPFAPAPHDRSTDVRGPTEWHADRSWSGPARVAHAKNTKQEPVKALFGAAGVAFPAKELMFRVYKKEAQVEVWAGSGKDRMARVATYGICAASGELGPKRAEGDMQVPEGFYTLSYFHPESQYYLAALVDYPNLSDKIRGNRTPGGQILMHGSCASIGCISMTDERMEELYLMAWSTWRDSGARTHVHIFPSRDIDGLLADASLHEHHAFWRELDAGKRAFESSGHIPEITIERDGRYVVAGARR
jgi:hypothetical protein